MSALKLHHYWRSSCSWRVRLALAYKGVACEWNSVNLLDDETDRPEQRSRNPLGYLPVFEFLNEPLDSPQRYLAESTAMIEWLEETIPQPALLVGSPWERARQRQLAQIINADTQPLQNLNVFHRHSSDAAEQVRVESRVDSQRTSGL